jgi:hypothetical protein
MSKISVHQGYCSSCSLNDRFWFTSLFATNEDK